MKISKQKISCYDKCRGMRLKECREYRKLTQEALAEALNVSTNYISMLERGQRLIDWNKAVKFAEVLNVQPSFIMRETDLMIDNNNLSFMNKNTEKRELFFINFLMSMGYEITFHVIKLYDGALPEKLKNNDLQENIWDSLHINVDIDCLIGVNLLDPHCKLQLNGSVSEVVIHKVTINDIVLSFGCFTVYIKKLYSIICSTLLDIKSTKKDDELFIDALIEMELYNSRFKLNGLPMERENLLQDLERQIEK